MKKSFLLLIPALFLVASCGEEPKKPKCPEGTCVDADHDTMCDVCGYQCVFDFNHAVKCKGDPNYSVQIGVGETIDIEAVLDPNPYKYSERDFTWENKNPDVISFEVNAEKSAKGTVKGLKSGSARLIATNTYNINLVHEFEIRVINFDSESMYLWQYDSDRGDRAQFGYDSKVYKQGIESGTAVLQGMKWDFNRNKVTSLQSGEGLGFGKGGDPETDIKLLAKNDRKVKRVSLETASANGLATLLVKVGDTTVIERATPSSASDGIREVSSSDLDNLEGDISIEFITPEVDPSRAEDPTYLEPGAVYLKSIFIEFEGAYSYKTTKSLDLAAKFNNPEDPDFKGLTGTAKQVVINDENFEITFDKLAKPGKDDKIQGYAVTNGFIDIKAKNNNEVIKKVELEFQVGGSVGNYEIQSSVFGGEPYLDKLMSSKTGYLGTIIYDSYVNAIRFADLNAFKIGLKSLKIYTITGEHAVVDSVKLADDATPTKVNYYEGQKFEPAGLGDVTISFVDNIVDPIKYDSANLVFFDANSYDNPADHSGASEILKEGTTQVVALFANKEIRVSIEPVEMKTTTFEKVKAIADLTSGKYLLTAPAKKGILQGTADSSSTFGASKYIDYVEDCEFGDEITINYLFENQMISITKVEDIYHISNATGKNFGMTGSHGVSISSSPKYADWTISIDDSGFVTMSLVDEESVTYYYGYGTSTFKFETTNKNNIALYKIAD